LEIVSSAQALQNRRKQVNPNSGKERWRTPFMGIGTRMDEEVRDTPFAFLVEMTPDSVLPTHFHPVDQFQVFVSGSGLLGRHKANGLYIHYADRHTAYGPITAGPRGVAYFTLRAKNDARGMFLNKPGMRELLQPSKRRFRMTENILLSIPPVLADTQRPVVTSLLEDEVGNDGLGAFVLRAGASAKLRGPDPAGSGGQFCLVVNGTLHTRDSELPSWSLIWVGAAEAAPELCAGPAGVEILVVRFPIPH
jgi:hypothetical protein